MNRVCEILNIEKPVIQGPMAWISTAPLVAAVSNAGGLGVLGVGFAPESFIREQIAETRKLTDKPFGMNVIMIPPNLEHVTKIVLDEKPQSCMRIRSQVWIRSFAKNILISGTALDARSW